MAINAEGVFEYNGVQFDVFGVSNVSAAPVYDDANRMVKYVEITLHFKGVASAGSQGSIATDDFVDFIRRRLTSRAGPLRYQNKGFGDFTVNVGTLWDVAYGPMPKLMTFVPIGSRRACYVEWQCVTRVPQCPNGDQVLTNGIVELTYSVNWTLDLDGIHVVTTTGKIEIAKNFGLQAPNFNRTADDFWEQIYIPQRPGWQRDQRTKHLSLDRRTLTFTFQDRELPVPLPVGQTRAEIRHSFKSVNKGFVQFHHTISGKFHTDRSLSRFKSLTNFFICVNNIKTNILANSGVSLVPIQLECSEEILGLEDSYSFSFLSSTKVDKMITSSGLWQQIPRTSHTSWIASIVNSSGAPRGLLRNNAKYDISKDILVDLCITPIQHNIYEPFIDLDENGNPRPIANNNDEDADVAEFYDKEKYLPEGADENWIDWKMELVDVERNHIVRHKPLYGTTTPTEFEADLEKPNTLKNLPNSVFPHSEINVESDAEDLLQKISTPSCAVILRGRAVRYGARIPIPRLIRYGEAEIIQLDCVSTERNIGASLSIPIYERTWEITYLLNRPQRESPNIIKPYPGLRDDDYNDSEKKR